jgi:hypothetical protein
MANAYEAGAAGLPLAVFRGYLGVDLPTVNPNIKHITCPFTGEELVELAGRCPSCFSPNVTLRPVVQDYLLPTAAYIGGPAEIAYFAQSEAIYRTILGRMPVAVPRAGFTVLDARSQKLIARYGLSLTDFFHGDEILKERIASKLIPAGLNRVMQEMRQGLRVFAEDIADVIIASVVPPLTPVFQAAAEQYLKREALVVSHEMDLGVKLLVDNPWETGADRMISALATHRLYGGPAIVIQFGTATSFDCVSSDGDFLGGAIAPGLGYHPSDER